MNYFKKSIMLGGISVIMVIIILFTIKNNKQYEEMEVGSFNTIEDYEEPEEEKDFIIIHITGEVINPGIIKIKEGERIKDAIDAAGGLTPNADTNKINLAYVVSDGQKIYIPSIFDETEKQLITEEIGESVLDGNTEKKTNKININTATQTELEELKGIGPSTALKIIKYRKENGTFKSIEEIKYVPGIGEGKFKEIEDEICV